MIPVLGMPVLNKHDLMQRMFDSIDYGPIDRLYIIDNSSSIDKSAVRWPWHINRIHVADPGYNTGVAAAWNMIVRANIHADWWLICNNDMTLEPGVLKKVVDVMSESGNVPTLCRVAMGNESWGHHFGAFAVNGGFIDTVGWFDENLIPIYFEDTDCLRRVEQHKDALNLVLIPSTTHHDGNRSWSEFPLLAAQNKFSWDGNVQYIDSKWGDVHESDGMVYWPQPKVQRIRAQDWHIDRKDNVREG
jgi:GT2 family glycosyltransferase